VRGDDDVTPRVLSVRLASQKAAWGVCKHGSSVALGRPKPTHARPPAHLCAVQRYWSVLRWWSVRLAAVSGEVKKMDGPRDRPKTRQDSPSVGGVGMRRVGARAREVTVGVGRFRLEKDNPPSDGGGRTSLRRGRRDSHRPIARDAPTGPHLHATTRTARA
jgi:hypothetical protein